jgi:heme/copper-type cytochrome/quinol oxidase subunit 3
MSTALYRPDVPLSDALSGRRSPAWWGMVWFCATEAMLFACFLASYFFLRGSVEAFGAEGGRYVPLARPLVMTALLLSSSAAAWWADEGIRRGEQARLRIGLAVATLLGLAFLGVQAWEYSARDVSWTASAYDSLFITITGFHGAHVAGGLLMLLFVQLRAWLGHFDAERHEAASNAILYWHFVDGVWLCILASLYLSPRLF